MEIYETICGRRLNSVSRSILLNLIGACHFLAYILFVCVLYLMIIVEEIK